MPWSSVSVFGAFSTSRRMAAATLGSALRAFMSSSTVSL
jgi:hypothetical protein